MVGAFSLVEVGVMKLAQSESALNDLSERAGTTVENIERLTYVSSQTGSSANIMQASLDNLSRMAGGAAMEMAGAVRTFADIGIRVQDVNGTIKDTAVLLDEIGNAVTHLENSQIFALERPGLDRTLIRSMTEDMTALVAEFDGMAGATGVNFARSSKTASKLMDELGKTRTFTGILSKALGTELMEDLVTGLQRARQKIRDNFSSIKWDIDVAVKTGTMLATTFIERNARRWCGSIPKRRARPRPLSP